MLPVRIAHIAVSGAGEIPGQDLSYQIANDVQLSTESIR